MDNFLMRIIACTIPVSAWRKKIRQLHPVLLFDRWVRRHRYQVHYQDIPIYIISFNRLSGLKLLIERLQEMGYLNIHIIDNNSSYGPLLRYLEKCPYPVYFLQENLGHLALWKDPRFTAVVRNSFYAVTDPDVIPIDDCPDNFLDFFCDVLCKKPSVTKVGFSLKIDDLPEHYALRDIVIDWESRSYKHEFMIYNQIAYRCGSDTTFALYGPQKKDVLKNDFFKAIRIGYPYQLKHLPWYTDLSVSSEEDEYYRNSCNKTISTWNGSTSACDIKQRFGID